ncbi:MAG TPA: RsfA family transcriptional regulator [Bacillota bacterium]|nr:RsfA family transcriptional regulator [Bacillota bacterium]
MKVTRQDAWSEEEDIILAETVLRYIREGKTQLEAFKDVARELSRTSAACGFRWNASIRKKYQDAITQAKEKRKYAGQQNAWRVMQENKELEDDPIQTAISLLKNMQLTESNGRHDKWREQEKHLEELKQKNAALEKQLLRYHQAWEEMGKLWNWVTTDQS